MEICSVSKAEEWKSLQKDNLPTSKNQAHSAENSNRDFDSKEMKGAKDNVKIKQELPMKKEEIHQNKTFSKDIIPQEYGNEIKSIYRTLKKEELRSYILSNKTDLRRVDMSSTEENLLISDINDTKQVEAHSEILRESKQNFKEEAHTESDKCRFNLK
ncbi:hypothetical protein O181_098703 [Austropuccinia psidii MF-1]|uniref:Uncharacterized protein n=1 Tax=Austropuccinia psidii MF-1 TaxID=1389203 RepID=A0A9Q3JBC5_9BASI|nr:hypothetical protein [Austropuccinia psidii MF-1]